MGEMSRLLVLQKVLHVSTTELSTDTNYKENFSDAMAQALIYHRVPAEVGCRSQATPSWDLWSITSHRKDLFSSNSVSFVALHQCPRLIHLSQTLYNLSKDSMVSNMYFCD